MSKKIKLDQDIVKAFKSESIRKLAVIDLLEAVKNREVELWNQLKKIYPDVNMSNAIIDNDTGTLIAPFEEPEK